MDQLIEKEPEDILNERMYMWASPYDRMYAYPEFWKELVFIVGCLFEKSWINAMETRPSKPDKERTLIYFCPLHYQIITTDMRLGDVGVYNYGFYHRLYELLSEANADIVKKFVAPYLLLREL